VSLARQKHSQFQWHVAWARQGCLACLLVLCSAVQAAAGCIDAAGLASSVVSITRYFDTEERKLSQGNLAIRGTAWLLSATSIVTAEHVAEAMRLSHDNWKLVEIGDDERQSVALRIARVAGARPEKIAVLDCMPRPQRHKPSSRGCDP
jgi:hypothetical protein